MADKKSAMHDTHNAPNDAAVKAAIGAGIGPGKALGDGGAVPQTPDKRWGVESCCVRQFWAVIERDASLVRGRNVLRTKKLGTGIYEIFFTGDVSNGAFVATIGRPGIATEPTGEITVALRCCPGFGDWTPFDDNKGVWVQTFDSTGQPSDRSFHLIVLTQDQNP
jgi:hypothetical protein